MLVRKGSLRRAYRRALAHCAPFCQHIFATGGSGGVQLSGGVGSVVGAVLGTITLGLISNGMNMVGVSPFFRAALTGVLLLGAVSLQKRKAMGI